MVFICLIHILFLTCCLWPRNCEQVGDHIVPSQEADRVTRAFPSLYASTSEAHLPEATQLLKTTLPFGNQCSSQDEPVEDILHVNYT